MVVFTVTIRQIFPDIELLILLLSDSDYFADQTNTIPQVEIPRHYTDLSQFLNLFLVSKKAIKIFFSMFLMATHRTFHNNL